MSGAAARFPSFLEALSGVVGDFGEQAAIIEGSGRTISYAELWSEAETLSWQLAAQGIGSGSVVALCYGHSIDHVRAVLAVWMRGAAFCPIDPLQPADRRERVLQSCGADLVALSDDRLPAFAGQRPLLARSGAPAQRAPLVRNLPEDPAYLIYTSGSSGQPKGVLVPHRGITNLLFAQIEAFDIGPGDRALMCLSTAFDASISDIGTALLAGATICIQPGLELSQSGIYRAVERLRITHLDLPPAILPTLDPDLAPPTLRTIVIGGEACAPQAVRRWAGRLRLVNVYGPTEATICSSLCICGPEWERPLIGRAIPNVELTAMRTDGSGPAAPGEPGELYIGGLGLALGYKGLPELSAAKFVQIGGRRLYRSGDLVRALADGSMEFLGRLDRQIKLRGQLVEPGEIEARLFELDGIEQAAVLGLSSESQPGKAERLAAYLVVDPGRDVQRLRVEIFEWLRSKLPGWMIPAELVFLPALPLNHSSKVDYGALASLTRSRPSCERAAPRTGLEERLSRILGLVIGRDGLGHDEDFFEAGGDSLAALRAVACAEAEGLPLSCAMLKEFPRLSALAGALQGEACDGALARPELERLAALGPELEALAARVQMPAGRAPLRNILLTGASGFLGSAILAKLSRRGCERIYCLVRAADARTGREKIARALAQHGAATEELLARVEILTGDLASPRLGLAPAEWERLCGELDQIVAAGAEVNLAKSYYELAPANVGGVREVLRLACSGRPKELHYVSTLSVLVASDRSSGLMREDDDLTATGCVYGGYAQSKWVAERLLWNARAAGFQGISIVRPGLITGNSRLGLCRPRDLLSMLIAGLARIGCVPKDGIEELAVDVTPVDFAAAAIAGVVTDHPDPFNAAFHVANERSLALTGLIDHMRSFGFHLDPADPDEWRRRIESIVSAEASAAQPAYLALCRLLRSPDELGRHRHLDLFQATGVTFDTRRARQAAGMACPEASEPLVHLYIRRLLEEPELWGALSVRQLGEAERSRGHEPETLASFGLGRADIYDHFLFKGPETPRILAFHQRLARHFGIHASQPLLEIGCGTGRLLRGFASIFGEVHGLDPDRDYLARARERARGCDRVVDLRLGGFGDLEERDRYAWVTSVNGPLFYLHSPEEREDAIARIFAALRPGGIAFVDVANFPYLLKHYGQAINLEEKRTIGGASVRRRMSHDFDFHRGLWIHRDRYELSCPGRDPAGYQESFSFAIITPPELRALFEKIGFADLAWFASWDSPEPAPCNGSRIMLAARKPAAQGRSKLSTAARAVSKRLSQPPEIFR